MRRLALLLLTAALPAVAAAPAQAVDCSATPPLTDPAGFEWEGDTQGDVFSADHDGLDDAGAVYFDFDYYQYYDEPPGSECTTEDGGREVVYPTQEGNGVETWGKIFVPESGRAFVRHVWFFRNTNDTPVALHVHRWNRLDYAVKIRSSSSGDTAVTPADDWYAFNNEADATVPTTALIWQGGGARRTAIDMIYDECCARPPAPVQDGTDDPQWRYGLMEIAPGETKSLAMYALARGSADEAAAAAADLTTAPDEAFAAMSDDEIRTVQNFVPRDADRDGVANEADNCLTTINADQADTDGDRQGDACDADDDNDGLGDALEPDFRTDPRRADTDGDGRSDRDDACPITPGRAGDGCPRFDRQITVDDILGRADPKATTVQLTPARDRRAPFRFVARGTVVPPDGLSAQQACSSAGFVSMQVKRRGATISTRRARLASDCSYRIAVTFRNRRRIGPGRQRLRFTIRWLGNRYLEPVTIRTLTRRVG